MPNKTGSIAILPIIALLSIATSLPLAGCSDNNDSKKDATKNDALNGGRIKFTGIASAQADEEKRAVVSTHSVEINGKEYAINFNTIIRSADRAGDGIFGQLHDIYGHPIKSEDGSEWISNSSDFSSLLTGSDNKLYMVSHFENSPGTMYVTELNQSPENGKLSAIRTKPLNFSSFKGDWAHCAGSVTPWGTHLGSEEYEPDARAIDPETKALDSYDNNQALYFGLDPNLTMPNAFIDVNPYYYGYQIEVKVNDFDHVAPQKHYAMGRIAHELAYVMPNKKTAYISDDGTNVGLFRFEADKEGDLSSGFLYVAKWKQTSADKGGSANLDWINLGHATDAEIRAYIDQKLNFDSIFESADPTDKVAGTCPDGFSFTNTTRGTECLKIKEGMEKAASRMETRRYAAMKGGTTEFRKMEGITHNPDDNVLYVSLSSIERGMEDGFSKAKDTDKYDRGGNNDIRLPLNRCGTVYALDLDDNYLAKNMHSLVEGIPTTESYGADDDSKKYDETGPFGNNKCHLDGLSNPDNLTFMPGYKTLIIGEDTGDGHQNDLIWSYNLESKTLTRILSTPYGSETTSPYFYPNINGWAYLMSVVQHPYGESDKDKLVAGSGADKSYTGYIGPFPAMDK
jgi:secreted PhoX family phosphatase